MFKTPWEELKNEYYDLSKIVFDFVMEQDVYALPQGRYELPDGCYVNLDEYDTRENCNFEAHRKYVDVHFMMEGEEEIFYAPASSGRETKPYDEEKDVAFYVCDDATYDKVELLSGQVVVLFPDDLHAPCNGKKRHNRKLVFKIPISIVK